MNDLIARLEAAEEGSRELDWLIADYLGEIPQHEIREVGWNYVWWRRPKDFYLSKANDAEGRNIETWAPKRRTTNLQAAVDLVPEGLSFLVGKDHRTGWATLGQPAKPSGTMWDEGYEAKTPALALCAAILRAKEEK